MEKVVECINLEKKYFLFDKDYKVIPWLFTKKGCSEVRVPLTNINLTINKGDVVGFVGKNGAGKSTLMKIIAGITRQTDGGLEVNGRVNSLINLGAGFNPKYTGRQNIYYKGLLMGMTKKDIDDIIDEIIDFCELGSYFDLPLYMYSSGMSARLGFSLAIFADHEILIVDEVFAVGDKMFQAKSAKKMQELFQSGKSIIFASHSDALIRQFCNRAIFIDESQIVLDGTVEEVLEAYNKKYSPDRVKAADNKAENKTEKDKYSSINNFMQFAVNSRKLDKADMYREIGVFFELEENIEMAYKYMCCAKKLRPGPAIVSRYELYKDLVDEKVFNEFEVEEVNLENINEFMHFMNNNFNIEKADIYRGIALFCEKENNLNLAYKYMCIASELRPDGLFISGKVAEYELKLKNNV